MLGGEAHYRELRARRLRCDALAAAAALLLLPGTAHAAPACPGVQTATTPVLQGQGSLESVIVDARGRLFYADTTARELRRVGRHAQRLVARFTARGVRRARTITLLRR